MPRIARQRAPLVSRAKMTAATSLKTADVLDYRMLGELASKVVQGNAERVRRNPNATAVGYISTAAVSSDAHPRETVSFSARILK